MKRLICALLAGAMLTAFAGCGQISDETYRRAAELEGISFPAASSGTSSGAASSVPFGTSSGTSSSASSSVPSGTSSGTSSAAVSSSSGSPSASSAAWMTADGGWYYSQLDEAQQENYRLLLEGFRNFAEEITGLQEVDKDTLFRLVHMVRSDHPELFWVPFGGGQILTGSRTVYYPEYLLSRDRSEVMTAEAEAAADAFLQTVDPAASDYDKLVAVFEHLTTVPYDDTGVSTSTLWGALVDGKARCSGYSGAMQVLLTRLGVPCTTVVGETLSGGPHQWNIVWIDGEPWHSDACWGTPGFSEQEDLPEDCRFWFYLMADTESILRSRTIDEQYGAVPLCTGDDNWYVRSGLLLEEYPGRLEQLYCAAVAEGRSWFTVQFASAELFREADAGLFDNGGIVSLRLAAGQERSGSHLSKEDQRTITFFFGE